eukprot:TRINITY_DN17708_c0_g1_i2.p1 TRINITY_DN17708_c0_g1~~TRINITY_DN17708_c0_g1_i2.p1  ORF type:complete len:199 (-),score=32.42 TRINITY_DN17708_c0_g1_i2:64-660(-)
MSRNYSERNSVMFEKQVPKFLQNYMQQQNRSREESEEKLAAKPDRPDRDDELPVIVNQDEYEFEIKNHLVSGLDSQEAKEEQKEIRVEDDVAAVGQPPSPTLSSHSIDGDEDAGLLLDPVNTAVLSRIHKPVYVGRRSGSSREEDEHADAQEAESGKHIFRRAKKRSLVESKSSESSKKEKKNIKKHNLSFDVDDEAS